MNKMPITVKLSAQDRFGRQLAARLDASAAALPHNLSERLRMARLQAMDKYRQVQVRQAALVSVGGGVAALGGDERGWWPRLVSIVPLMALIAGLIAIQMLSSNQLAEELAELDTAILTDDLPPDAYADPGFAQFLKARLDQSKPD